MSVGIKEGFVGALFGGGVGWGWSTHGDLMLGLGLGIANVVLGLVILAVIWVAKRGWLASPFASYNEPTEGNDG